MLINLLQQLDILQYMNTRYLMILFFLSTSLGANEKPIAPDAIPGVAIVSAEQAVALILSNSELIILDSRKEDEYAKGHIEMAISFPDTQMEKQDFRQRFPNQNRPFLVYCNGVHCLRSSNAAKKILQWGYGTLYWMRGGWQEWISKALPIAY